MFRFSLFQNYKPVHKLLLLLMVFIGFYIIIPIALMLFGITVWGAEVVVSRGISPMPLSYLIFFQLSTQLLVFGGSALFFAALVSDSIFDFLRFNFKTNGKFLLMTVLAILFVIPLAGWLQQISLSATYPESWQPMIDSFKRQEDMGNIMMMRFLNVDGIGWLLFNILFLAIIPAICEELLFRGALIGVLKKMIKNKHILVVVSAIIFSAIHLQFFSFFSRFVLGLVLGYAFVYAGSIIPSMVAHFVNNALSVVLFYFSDRTTLDDVGTVENFGIIAISTIAAVFTIVWMNKYHKKIESIEV